MIDWFAQYPNIWLKRVVMINFLYDRTRMQMIHYIRFDLVYRGFHSRTEAVEAEPNDFTPQVSCYVCWSQFFFQCYQRGETLARIGCGDDVSTALMEADSLAPPYRCNHA